MKTPQPTIYVVDDDSEVRRALKRRLPAVRFELCPLGTAVQFLSMRDLKGTGCIILDIAQPRLAGLDLQSCLALSGCRRPIIFLCDEGDVAMSVQAMRAGALNVLEKPVDPRELSVAVDEALCMDAKRQTGGSRWHKLEQRFGTLTLRERQVLEGIMVGRLNKQIAADLGLVLQTIKAHRAQLMRKLGARSVVDLICLVAGVEGVDRLRQ